MKTITRGIIGAAGALCVGTTIGTIGSTVMMKAAESYGKTKGKTLALYSAGSVGCMIIAWPVIDNVATRITNWVFKEEDEKLLDEIIERNEQLLKQQKEES